MESNKLKKIQMKVSVKKGGIVMDFLNFFIRGRPN